MVRVFLAIPSRKVDLELARSITIKYALLAFVFVIEIISIRLSQV